jgi:hypothetical protein
VFCASSAWIRTIRAAHAPLASLDRLGCKRLVAANPDRGWR